MGAGQIRDFSGARPWIFVKFIVGSQAVITPLVTNMPGSAAPIENGSETTRAILESLCELLQVYMGSNPGAAPNLSPKFLFASQLVPSPDLANTADRKHKPQHVTIVTGRWPF